MTCVVLMGGGTRIRKLDSEVLVIWVWSGLLGREGTEKVRKSAHKGLSFQSHFRVRLPMPGWVEQYQEGSWSLVLLLKVMLLSLGVLGIELKALHMKSCILTLSPPPPVCLPLSGRIHVQPRHC
jgi:hypothetical protein